jgi:hypothetical protein
MSIDSPTLSNQSKAMTIVGWILTVLPCPLLVMSATFKLMQSEVVTKGFEEQNWPLNTAVPLGIVELVSTILYLIPQTTVLGAILLTGYLGGATAVHVRLSEPFWMPVAMGVVLWLGIYLRDPRLRALTPLRSRI